MIYYYLPYLDNLIISRLNIIDFHRNVNNFHAINKVGQENSAN